MDLERIALIITRIYGATFLALGAGWLIMALSAFAIKAALLSVASLQFAESASYLLSAAASATGFFIQACVYLVAGAAVTGLSRRIAKFAVQS